MLIYGIFKQEEVVYVGQTQVSVLRRWQKHCSIARTGKGYILHAAMRKYGEDAFQIVELATCRNQEDLNATETALIEQYSPRYNIIKEVVGNGGYISGEHYQKMSEMFKGRANSWSVGRKHSHASRKLMQKKRQLTEAGRAKLRRPKSEETRKKMSEANQRRQAAKRQQSHTIQQDSQ